MLAIKLQRIGKKKQASFRVVIAEKRSKMSNPLEDLGFFNPHSDKLEIKKERISYWLGKGAKPTDTIFNLLIKAGILTGPKKAVHKKPKKEKTEGEQPKKKGKEAAKKPEEAKAANLTEAK